MGWERSGCLSYGCNRGVRPIVPPTLRVAVVYAALGCPEITVTMRSLAGGALAGIRAVNGELSVVNARSSGRLTRFRRYVLASVLTIALITVIAVVVTIGYGRIASTGPHIALRRARIESSHDRANSALV